jgi:Zn-dependent metalloprotease
VEIIQIKLKMKLKLLFNCLLKLPGNNKIFILSSILFLSAVTFGQNNNDVIKTYLSDNLERFDLVASDIVEWKITNEVFSKQSKVTNVYIQQLYKGIPIFNAVSNISIKDNKVIFSGNSFVRNISSKVNGTIPVLNAKAAITQTASQLKLGSISNSQLIEQNNTHKFTFSNSFKKSPDAQPISNKEFFFLVFKDLYIILKYSLVLGLK